MPLHEQRKQPQVKDKHTGIDKVGHRGVSRGEQVWTLELYSRGTTVSPQSDRLYLRRFVASGTLAMQTAKWTAASQDPVTHGKAKSEI